MPYTCSYFFTRLTSEAYGTYDPALGMHYDYDGVKRWMRKVDVLGPQLDVLLVPLHCDHVRTPHSLPPLRLSEHDHRNSLSPQQTSIVQLCFGFGFGFVLAPFLSEILYLVQNPAR